VPSGASVWSCGQAAPHASAPTGRCCRAGTAAPSCSQSRPCGGAAPLGSRERSRGVAPGRTLPWTIDCHAVIDRRAVAPGCCEAGPRSGPGPGPLLVAGPGRAQAAGVRHTDAGGRAWPTPAAAALASRSRTRRGLGPVAASFTCGALQLPAPPSPRSTAAGGCSPRLRLQAWAGRVGAAPVLEVALLRFKNYISNYINTTYNTIYTIYSGGTGTRGCAGAGS
jgi:hypothetical protein